MTEPHKHPHKKDDKDHCPAPVEKLGVTDSGGHGGSQPPPPPGATDGEG